MTFTRRDFLKAGGAAVTVSFLAPRLALPSSMQQDRILVILQLAGGNDGINTFIPYTDAKYR
ncbi:MAG: twin-arginine translocation signal domain-containing protein, partial [Acidobacteria bacterium]|nr:twin-arginine translocation signal domain-containing protein [Acidobacteriota bacterium]